VSGIEKGLRISSVQIEASPIKNLLLKSENSLVINISDAKKFVKFSVKILIDKNEDMRVENESVILLN
jgi:hypothetical protein